MSFVGNRLDPSLYTIALITPLPIEAQAAMHMLDARHEGSFPHARGDDYIFKAGEMCGHNVIIAKLGRQYGTGAAAALSSQIKKFFPNLWFALLVGIGAGLPKHTGPKIRDIRLGDVLVAMPENETAALVAYGLGKETESGFHPLRGGHALAPTESIVHMAIDDIKDEYPDEVRTFIGHYERIKDRALRDGGTFADPGQEHDTLHAVDENGKGSVVPREARPAHDRTRVWYGPIGSGDLLMKKASVRDGLRDRYDLIGLEMEAAGTMNCIAAGVVRGVCDYGDEYKTDQWQPYAAAMAAAYAKAILARIGPKEKAEDKQVTDKAGAGVPTRGKTENAGGDEGERNGTVNWYISNPAERTINGMTISGGSSTINL